MTATGRTGERVPLAPFTTLGLGGPARRLREITSAEVFVDYARAARSEDTLVLGHGSNVVVSDDGYAGTVLVMRDTDISARDVGDGRVEVTTGAGVSLACLVQWANTEGLSGLECLAGIPGTVGATPVQNVSAYGQEMAERVVEVSAWDWVTRRRVAIPASACGFGYRTSVFKRDRDRYTILSVTMVLPRDPLSRPVSHHELASELDVPLGTQVRIADVAPAVIAIRRRKGMVVDPDDTESRSVGSFFLNPTIRRDDWESFTRRVHEVCGRVAPPRTPAPEGAARTSAAWLIERAGFARGQRLGTARISRKHTLALVAEDSTSALDVHRAANAIARRVADLFGVSLVVEPRFVGPFVHRGQR